MSKNNDSLIDCPQCHGEGEYYTDGEQHECFACKPHVKRREISLLLLDEHAFNDTFNENKLYKPDIDHHWLYNFVSYYESAKLARANKPVLGSPDLPHTGIWAWNKEANELVLVSAYLGGYWTVDEVNRNDFRKPNTEQPVGSAEIMAALNAIRAEYNEKPIKAQSGFSVKEWQYGERIVHAVLAAAPKRESVAPTAYMVTWDKLDREYFASENSAKSYKKELDENGWLNVKIVPLYQIEGERK